jgi:Transglutaminase-like superfamily
MQSYALVGKISHIAPESGVEPAVSPAYFLSDHAYCCEFDEGAVILDLRNDRYAGIDAQHVSNLRKCIGNWPDPDRGGRVPERHENSAAEGLIADLLARGMLTTTPTSTRSAPPKNPTVALAFPTFAEAHGRVPLTHIAQFSIAFLAVVLCLRMKCLASLIDWLRRRQSSIRGGDSAKCKKTADRLTSFVRLRTWCYTAQRRCLFDSLVLSVYLTRAMVPCTFVIGVALKPFLAHAWVQVDTSVINDTAEHVHNFKPILNVGGA